MHDLCRSLFLEGNLQHFFNRRDAFQHIFGGAHPQGVHPLRQAHGLDLLRGAAVGDDVAELRRHLDYFVHADTAEKAGVIESILVENGQPVEYDQPLFTIV